MRELKINKIKISNWVHEHSINEVKMTKNFELRVHKTFRGKSNEHKNFSETGGETVSTVPLIVAHSFAALG